MMIPEGKYRAKARSAEIGEAKTGTVQVRVDFEFTSAAVFGQHLDWFGYFSEKAVDRTLEALRHSGWIGNDPDDLSSLSRDDVPEVELVIEHEVVTDENKAPKLDEHGEVLRRPRVRWVNAARVAMKQLDPGRKAAFGQSVRAALAAVDQRLGVKPAPVAAPMQPAGDIPFAWIGVVLTAAALLA